MNDDVKENVLEVAKLIMEKANKIEKLGCDSGWKVGSTTILNESLPETSYGVQLYKVPDDCKHNCVFNEADWSMIIKKNSQCSSDCYMITIFNNGIIGDNVSSAYITENSDLYDEYKKLFGEAKEMYNGITTKERDDVEMLDGGTRLRLLLSFKNEIENIL